MFPTRLPRPDSGRLLQYLRYACGFNHTGTVPARFRPTETGNWNAPNRPTGRPRQRTTKTSLTVNPTSTSPHRSGRARQRTDTASYRPLPDARLPRENR